MATGRTDFLKSEISYVTDLVDAGMGGAISAWKGSARPGLAPGLTGPIWQTAVVGSAIGILSAYLARNRRAVYRVAVSGLVGSAVGASAGMAWTSRASIRAAARGATRKVNAVRDARWLEKNPINYA